jgi:hypothetical protein
MPTSLQQGIDAAKAGNTQQALEHLKDAIIEEPQNADVWVWIAAIINNLEKQEIFLKKALEIDPRNIPAQRGLSYLQKRKQQDNQVRGHSLTDHTQPISPFPHPALKDQSPLDQEAASLKSDELVSLASQEQDDNPPPPPGVESQPPTRLTTLEIILLIVVVVVFAFIGLLASSALFDFDLPWGLLTGSRPSLNSDPPYPGVFLYDDQTFFDMQAHEGPPVSNVGIPTSTSPQPVAVFWQTDSDAESIKLLYESGTYMDHKTYGGRSQALLIQPSTDLEEGLYCLQEIHPQPPDRTDTYYCFYVDLSLGE